MVQVRRFVSPLLIVLLYSLLAFYKLDYNYIFTDEILYAQRGLEALNGVFTDTLQVPLIAKYLAGVSYYFFKNDVYLLRLLFVVFFIFTNLLIYRFLSLVFDKTYALMGSIFYISTISVFESNRMLMLEPVMHFFWILFLYFYYHTFITKDKKNYYFSGILLGLSLATKFTSLTLVAFLFLGFLYKIFALKFSIYNTLKNYFQVIYTAVVVFTLTYIHFFYKLGFKGGILAFYDDFKSHYVDKNLSGKIHVIDNKVYTISPYWSYFYYSYISDGVVKTFSWFVSLFSFLKIDLNLFYFGSFFVINFILFESMGVQNERYLSSMFISLIFLLIMGIKNISEKVKLFKYLFHILLLISVVFHLNYLYKLEPTRYLSLFNYLNKMTNNFTDGQRVYAYGSVRSLNWYRGEVKDPNLFLIRRDYEIMCPEFYTFSTFVFDKEEMQKINFTGNTLYDYVKSNEQSYRQINDLNDFIIYQRVSNNEVPFICPTKKEVLDE